MNLSGVRKGDYFTLNELGDSIPFMADEDAHIEVKDGENYIVIMARNVMSDISIPLSVHCEYQHYLKIEPLYWADKPDIKMQWSDGK